MEKTALPALKLDRHRHHDLVVLAIRFEYTMDLYCITKEDLGAKWSQSKRFWYLPFNADNLKKAMKAFEGLAEIDRKKLDFDLNIEKLQLKHVTLTPESKLQLQRFGRWMETKRMSPKTVVHYVAATAQFLKYVQEKRIEEPTFRTVAQFNYDFVIAAQRSVSYQNIMINALKHYFAYCEKDLDIAQMERPIREKRLPSVLSMEEVKRLLSSTNNLKHRAMLSLVYSAGLRISELLALEANCIDSDRMLIHIKKAKGNKDRYTLLSVKVLALLREYYRVYEPRRYLFEGRSGEQYSDRSAQEIIKAAAKRAGITKPVTLHTLRHSFATHLLENGTDIRYIQNLLGHASPKTTMIYTHVSNASVSKIKNPFDYL